MPLIVSGSVVAANNAPTGSVTINNTATQGVVLTANVSLADADGISSGYSYQWQYLVGSTWTNIVGATAATFSPTQTQVNYPVRVAVSYTDGKGKVETVNSNQTLPVENVNDAPTVANAIADASTAEDAAYSFVVPANTFNDVDVSDTLTYTATLADDSALPAWLSFNAATRTFSGTPANGDVGVISVKVTANDGTVSISDTFDLTVTNTNDAPTVANAIAAASTAEDAAYSFVVPANTFNDVDVSDTLTYTATLADDSALPAWLSFNAETRTFSGTPANGDVVAISVKVTATDGSAATVSDTFVLTVTNTNDAPTVANPIADQNGAELSAFSFTVPVDTFADVDTGDTLTYTATLANDDPLPNWLTFNPATRTFSGTPGSSDFGTLSVKVTATDGSAATVSDTFVLTVTNTNDAPTVANAIADASTAEDAAYSFVVPANTFNDVDAGDSLTYTATLADGSALPAWLSFNAETRTFSGTPANGDVGAISVKVTATDGSAATVSDTFVLTVTNTNDAPTVANAIADASTAEDAAYSFVVPANTFNDVDVSDTLTYTATLADDSALPAWLSFNAETRTFSGTPANGDVGAISVKVTATDGSAETVSDTFVLTVTNTNDAPENIELSANSVAEGAVNGTVIGTLSATDIEDDEITFSVIDPVDVFSVNGSNQLVVAEGASLDYETQDSITITVQAMDANGASSTQEMTILLTNVNDNAPVLADSTVSIDENSAESTFVADLDADDADGELNDLTYTVTGGTGSSLFDVSAGGIVTVAEGAVLDYEDETSYTLNVEVTDGTYTDTATITINLNNLNDNTPTVTSPEVDSNNHIAENSTATIVTVTATDLDGSLSPLTFSLTEVFGENSLFQIDPTTGALSFIAGANFEEPLDSNEDNIYDVQVAVTDGENSSTQKLWVVVDDANDAPVIVNDLLDPALEFSTTTFTLDDLEASDEDDNPLTFTLTSLPELGQLYLNDELMEEGDTFTNDDINSGALKYANDGRGTTDLQGHDSFGITVGDGEDATAGTVDINVYRDNTAPILDLNGLVLGGINGNAVEYTEEAAAVVLAPVVSFTDTDTPDLTGGHLLVEVTDDSETADVLSVLNGGSNGRITISGDAVSFDGSIIGHVDSENNGIDGAALQINFDANPVSVIAVRHLVQSVTFASESVGTHSDVVKTITFNVNDGEGVVAKTSANATVTLTAHPHNDAPVATNTSIDVSEDATSDDIYNAVLAATTDEEGDELTIVSVGTGATMGTVTLGDGTLTYAADADSQDALAQGEEATDSFTFIVSDGENNSEERTVTVTVTGVNDAPVAADDINSIDADATEAVSGNVIDESDSDVDNGALLSVVGVSSTTGTPAGSITGYVDETIDTDYPNPYITIQVGDEVTGYKGIADGVDYYLINLDPGTYTVTRSTSTPNDPFMIWSVATPGMSYQGVYLQGATTQKTFTVTENGDFGIYPYNLTADYTFSIVTASSQVTTNHTVGQEFEGTYGTFLVNADGSYTYTVDTENVDLIALGEGDEVEDTITYTLTDEYGATDTATLTVTVNGVNDAPVIVAEGEGFSESNVPFAFDGVGGNPGPIMVSDAENDTITVTLTATSGTGTLSIPDTELAEATLDLFSGNVSAELTLRGTASAINAVIADLTFISNNGWYGTGSVTITATDDLDDAVTQMVDYEIVPTSEEYYFDAAFDELMVENGEGGVLLDTNVIYNFTLGDGIEESDYDSLTILNASAAEADIVIGDLDGNPGNGNNLLINFHHASLALVGVAGDANFDSGRITFDDGSFLKVNTSGEKALLLGGAADDQLIAGSMGDTIRGLAGNDKLVGGSGNDWLYGGSGDDEIVATAGNNMINGGAGNDIMTAGSGQDWFSYSGKSGGLNGGVDIINDFDITMDKIQLTGYKVVSESLMDSITFTDNSFAQDGSGDAVLLLADNSIITLVGVNVNDLTINNFAGYSNTFNELIG